MEKVSQLLRALELIFLIILTGLIGNVIATNINAAATATAAINFTMFVIVLSWLAAIYGLVTLYFSSRLSSGLPLLVNLGLDIASTLFTFIAAVVLAAKLTVVNCNNTGGQPSNWIAYGSANDGKRCREVQASTAFMWFLFATFTVGLVMSLMGFRRGGGSVRTGPMMSQVGV
ncbi:marvel domain-containing protein [Cladorrhinum sp. PSN332]|nr:marvel domain-containing protein [Cladorrhinum sp. PSN332]